MRNSRFAGMSAYLAVGVIVLGLWVDAGAEPVFPGAVGFGTKTPAGKGGRVIKVTNYNTRGPGSIGDALSSEGPRIIVFEIGGVIDLEGATVKIDQPFVTVAGQTAPSPGITLIGGSLNITTHDVLVQHIRIRPGDRGLPKRSGWEPDGIATAGPDAYNIVVDHCSTTWAVDENLSASGSRYDGPEGTSRNITFSHCIIAEGLSNSTHSKGEHSKGSLIHDSCTNIAIIGNLYAHNVNRNPYFKAFTTGVVVNNVIYNPKGSAVKVSWVESEWKSQPIKPENCRIAVVGNVMIHGRDTKENLALVAWMGDAYLEDNIALKRSGEPAPQTSGKVNELKEKPVWPEGLKPLPASQTLEHVLATVGARPKDRDEVDQRIVRDVRQRKGRIIDSQEQVGGYPVVERTSRTLNVPEDNVDAWLAGFTSQVQ